MKSLFLFAGDQKIEHLNGTNPEHFFQIASKAPIDLFATQLGLIESYGKDYSEVNYLVKLNSKTNIVPVDEVDPVSLQLHSVDDVVAFKKTSGLNIVGVGYTIYLGSIYEAQMLSQAAQVVNINHPW